MSSISNSGPASYTGDNRGAVLPADFLIATEDGVGRIGRLPGTLPGAAYRRPAGIYCGSEGVESAGGDFVTSGNYGGGYAEFLSGLRSNGWFRLTGIVLLTAADSPYSIPIPGGKATYICDCTAGAISILLPAVGAAYDRLATAFGMCLLIQKMDASANAVTITPAGTDLINGAGAVSASLTAQDQQWVAQAIGAFGGFNRWIA